jgi:hypothetical protein
MTQQTSQQPITSNDAAPPPDVAPAPGPKPRAKRKAGRKAKPKAKTGTKARRARRAAAGPLAKLARRLDREVTPHGLAILCDPAHQGSWLPWGLRRKLAELWTPSKVAALSTSALLQALAARGVTVDEARFAELAANRDSAWSIAEDLWRPASRDDAADNLLGLAAVELWKRWLPDRPARDVLGAWLAEGNRLLPTDRRAACALWLRVWQVLSQRLEHRFTLQQAAAQVDASRPLYAWFEETARQLCVLAADPSKPDPRGVGFCRELLARLRPGEEVYWCLHRGITAHLADMLFHLGRGDEGEAVYHELIGGREASMVRRWLAEALAYGADAATPAALWCSPRCPITGLAPGSRPRPTSG